MLNGPSISRNKHPAFPGNFAALDADGLYPKGTNRLQLVEA